MAQKQDSAKNGDLCVATTAGTKTGHKLHSSPLVKSPFCQTEIDHISSLTLYPGF